METFIEIVTAVKYAALQNFKECKNPEEKIKNEEVKKAMRYTVQKRLFEHCYSN
jgi:mannose-6-phosphate isomerase class I